ncbi:hypothetical protein [Streptomyces sp. WAC06614]|uniref:hypothetical protein n=1 Tax=Streptomyces sp. WAC06614 TaxID=2487416 RepID=UPI000F7A2254|nr:hypothetical protein [Streptomyces sp. WAC06614]RSS76773.1 hypothetical protein EF918_22980 [Streptomyces sp. WAC06614]
MFRRTRATGARAAIAALAAAGALLLGTVGQATAAPATAAPPTAAPAAAAPGFLQAGDLPAHPSSPWYAGPVAKGLPEVEVFCVEGVLPVQGSWHRQFGTDLDTGAVQVSVRTASTGAAARLVAALERKVAGCAAEWLRTHPEGTASRKDYGALDVEEGAHVYGVHTSLPESEPGVGLYGIGRDGATVTVVRWSRMGDLSDVPVPAFRRTTTTAVQRLAP